MLYQFIMDINAQESSSLPNSSNMEVAVDGSQLAGDVEVVRPIPPTSKMLQSTSDSLITPSNVGNTVEIEMKSDTNALDYSETEEILKVSLDHELSKKNLEETIQLKRVVPKFYPTMCRNEWLRTRTKMQFVISIKSMMRLFSAPTLSLLKWTV